MPLTANGKVNRRALPAPGDLRPEGDEAWTEPRTPVEETIAAIYADVLHLDRVGANGGFFELGGHSLSATQVVSRIREAFHIRIAVRALFEAPTVAALASAVEQIRRGDRGASLPPLVPVPRNRPLPVSLSQQRLWIADQLEPDNPLYNFPWAIRLTGTLDARAVEAALHGILRRHEVLRTHFGFDRDLAVQIVLPETDTPLPSADLTALPESERESEARRMMQEECGRPFDLSRDPMFRALLLKLGPEQHILFMNSHHIAFDGWSHGVFMRDFAALYEEAAGGKPAALPELPVQFADYAAWQREWLRGDALRTQLDYWKTRLAGAPPVLALPTDRPRPPVQTYRGTSHKSLLPESLMKAVRESGRRRDSTRFVTMLAAFQCLILYYSKQTDIVLGTDVAGRNDVALESLIGFFVNLLVLRTDLSGDPTVAELVARVRETALGAYSNQDAPFDQVVEEVRPERSLGHNPLVQVLFVEMSRMHERARLPGIGIGSVPLDIPSKFDMAVFVGDSLEGPVCTWFYNSDLFDATTVVRMANLYQLALGRLTSEDSMKVSELLAFLEEAERSRRAQESRQFQEASLNKLKSLRRRGGRNE